MNSGLISSRYATALLQFAREENAAGDVYSDAMELLSSLDDEQALPGCIEKCTDQTRTFISLVIKNGRVECLKSILRRFITLYRKSEGITKAALTVAAPSPQLEERLQELLRERGLRKVEFESTVDPGLLGGFVLQVDDLRLDASLRRGLLSIQKEFEDKNRKLL